MTSLLSFHTDGVWYRKEFGLRIDDHDEPRSTDGSVVMCYQINREDGDDMRHNLEEKQIAAEILAGLSQTVPVHIAFGGASTFW